MLRWLRARLSVKIAHYLLRLMSPSNDPDPELVPVAKSITMVELMVNVPVAAWRFH
jgi:hypothetical protein